jgi:hypothetical protein
MATEAGPRPAAVMSRPCYNHAFHANRFSYGDNCSWRVRTGEAGVVGLVERANSSRSGGAGRTGNFPAGVSGFVGAVVSGGDRSADHGAGDLESREDGLFRGHGGGWIAGRMHPALLAGEAGRRSILSPPEQENVAAFARLDGAKRLLVHICRGAAATTDAVQAIHYFSGFAGNTRANVRGRGGFRAWCSISIWGLASNSLRRANNSLFAGAQMGIRGNCAGCGGVAIRGESADGAPIPGRGCLAAYSHESQLPARTSSWETIWFSKFRFTTARRLPGSAESSGKRRSCMVNW